MAQIEQLEMDTVVTNVNFLGVFGPDRLFWREVTGLGFAVGASKGQETDYILVIYHQGGAVHGYPVTQEELRNIGVDL